MQAVAEPRDTPLDFRRPPQRYLDIGHCELAYRTLGSGPDLVLIHGWPLNSATWRRAAPLLAEHFRVHLIDLPGCGHTRFNEGTRIGLQEHADSIRAAADVLALERYAIAGNDSAGVIIRLLASQDRDRVSGAVVIDSEIPGHKSLLLWAWFTLCDTALGKKMMLISLGLRPIRRSLLGWGSAFYDRGLIDEEFYDLFVRPLRSSAHAASGQMRFVDAYDWGIIESLEQIHAQIIAPTLLVWGEDDPCFPTKLAREMVPQFGGRTELVVLPKARMYPHEERPREITEAIASFLLSSC